MTDTSPQVPAPSTSPNQARNFRTARSVWALIMREMSARYGRTPGGYAWTVLEPVLGLALMTQVFAIFLRTPQLGVNFPLFFATGFMPFILYRELESKSSSAIRFSKALLQYPGLTYVDSLLARTILTTITQVLVIYIILGGIILIWETRTLITPVYVLSGMGAAMIIGVGVGTFNCFVSGLFPIWANMWNILNRPLVLISGVIYLHDRVPQPWRGYLEWNPLVHVIGQFRRGFYVNYRGEYVDMVYAYGFGLVFLVVGLVLLNRHNRYIQNLL